MPCPSYPPSFYHPNGVCITNHEAPPIMQSVCLLLLPPAEVQISSSAPYSLTPSACVVPLMRRSSLFPMVCTCVTFRNILTLCGAELLAPHLTLPSWRITLCHPSPIWARTMPCLLREREMASCKLWAFSCAAKCSGLLACDAVSLRCMFRRSEGALCLYLQGLSVTPRRLNTKALRSFGTSGHTDQAPY